MPPAEVLDLGPGQLRAHVIDVCSTAGKRGQVPGLGQIVYAVRSSLTPPGVETATIPGGWGPVVAEILGELASEGIVERIVDRGVVRYGWAWSR